MERVQRISQHILVSAQGPPPLGAVPTASLSGPEKSDDDVVICCAVRTPTGKTRGNLRDTPCEEMLSVLFKAVLERTKVDVNTIGDCHIGNVLQSGSGAITARMGQFLAGLPYTVPLTTVNRQCNSGLQACINIAGLIKSGVIDIGIAGGVENMSMYNIGLAFDDKKLTPRYKTIPHAKNSLLSMGITSENVAEKYNISREQQDKMAFESNNKALNAQKMGWFDSEIIPVPTRVKEKDGTWKDVVVSKDEGPRASTLEALAKLKPAFKPGGTTTAANSSQTSDGAAMVLIARRSAAKKQGLPILARFRSYAVVGVDPALMGIGPAFAIPKALEKANLTTNDIDIYEINEAFASQASWCVQQLKLPSEKVNPKGGAIALGHALGCTGSRLVATILPELKRTGGKLGVVSMCLATGMGAAAVIENEQ